MVFLCTATTESCLLCLYHQKAIIKVDTHNLSAVSGTAEHLQSFFTFSFSNLLVCSKNFIQVKQLVTEGDQISAHLQLST